MAGGVIARPAGSGGHGGTQANPDAGSPLTGYPGYQYDPTSRSYVKTTPYAPTNFEEQLQSDKFSASQAALKALQAQMDKFMGTGYSPPGTSVAPATVGTDPYNPAADAATYGRAKENTGLAAQSALRGLRSSLAGRGVSGTGVERANTGQIFGGALSNLAETDRQLAEQTAGRSFTAGQSAADRAVTQRGQDIGLQESQQTHWLDMFKSLLSAYSSGY